jgi:hypothetical protein
MYCIGVPGSRIRSNEPSNYTMNPTTGGTLGMDFVYTRARRG